MQLCGISYLQDSMPEVPSERLPEHKELHLPDVPKGKLADSELNLVYIIV